MQTSRIWFTTEQKSELWERWKQGHSISAISRALARRNNTGAQGTAQCFESYFRLSQRAAYGHRQIMTGRRDAIHPGRGRPGHHRYANGARSPSTFARRR